MPNLLKKIKKIRLRYFFILFFIWLTMLVVVISIYIALPSLASVFPFFRFLIVFLLVGLIFLMIMSIFRLLLPLSKIENKISAMRNNLLSEEQISSSHSSNLDDYLDDILHQQELTKAQKDMVNAYLLREAEVVALQSQINPHFLFNALDSIRGFAMKKEVNEIADMTEALSKMFRNNLLKIGTLVPLSEEIESVHNYILIQNFRFPDRFELKLEYDEEDSNILCCQIPHLILQPLVENSIYHGLESCSRKGVIRITACLTQTRLLLHVIDNGLGISEQELRQLRKHLNLPVAYKEPQRKDNRHVGIGLVNIHHRLQAQFGKQYGLFITSTPNIMTDVEIVLPAIYPSL